jgi:4'-phosphopantetheinyl transferase
VAEVCPRLDFRHALISPTLRPEDPALAREGPVGEVEGGPESGVVGVWTASVDLPEPLNSHLPTYLSPDERERAGRFVFDRDRARFVAARAFLRLVLARSLGAEPRALRFRYSAHGKPDLADEGSDLGFNLAHSESLAVCVLARGCDALGVDVERVKPIRDVEDVARKAFSPLEFDRWTALPDPVRLPAFYEAWTRKEAFLKALGSGLDRPLDSFDVSFGPGERPRLLRVAGDPGQAERFSLHSFEPEHGYIGAVAIAGGPWKLRHMKWPWTERPPGP